ncbi:MAG: ATP-binding protein [Candidatus Promineifilaceae bacterium]
MENINRIIHVQTTDPEDTRQRRLLNILLLGVGTAAFIGLIITILLDILDRDPGGAFAPIYFSVTMVIVGMMGLLLINRYVSRWIAGILFILVIILSLVFGDAPVQVVQGRTLFMFAVPVLVSSFILRPYASFITAAVISIIINLIAFSTPDVIAPIFVAPLGLFIIALVAWLATDSLEQALQKLQVANKQLVLQSAELQATNTLLRQEIVERMQAEENLRQQTQILGRTNAELQQFVYISTHDLREPLRKVRTYSELLEKRYRGQLDDKADKYINYVVSGATRMQVLITDLLNYLGVGGVNEVARQTTDMNQVLAGVADDLDLLVQENSAVISHDPLPIIQADPIQMNHLLQNLVSNAIKFHSDRPLEIHIGAQRQNDDWLFSIADNGIGIEPQYLEQIFIIFKRVHTQEAVPGTGIGLAIAKKIVENHNGRIWAESTPDQGTTFFFTIPV